MCTKHLHDPVHYIIDYILSKACRALFKSHNALQQSDGHFSTARATEKPLDQLAFLSQVMVHTNTAWSEFVIRCYWLESRFGRRYDNHSGSVWWHERFSSLAYVLNKATEKPEQAKPIQVTHQFHHLIRHRHCLHPPPWFVHILIRTDIKKRLHYCILTLLSDSCSIKIKKTTHLWQQGISQ